MVVADTSAAAAAVPAWRWPSRPRTSGTFAERGHAYAVAVVAGEIAECKWVRLACERYLRDLERAGTDEFPYVFDGERAGSRVCRYIELLPHIKGKWAGRRERIRLEDWQCFFLTQAFGWVHRDTGLRRFRRVVLLVPRKNAKSTVAAGVGLYGATADGHYRPDGVFVPEFGAEVYCGATTERQAFEVFRPAWLMAQRTPDLLKEFGVSLGGTEKNPGTIYSSRTSSRFEVVIGKPGDGASPHISITDEYHEHETSEQLDTMRTGMMAREQPMALVISTAGVNINGPCYELEREVQKVLEGVLVDEQLFALVYTIDKGVDWKTEAALHMANPNYGVSVNADAVLADQREAVNDSRKQNNFRCKHLNIWNNARAAWMNMEWWGRQADPSLSLEQFIGEPCWGALDLASKLDLTCRLIGFVRQLPDGPPGLDGEPTLRRHLYVFGRHYLPADAAQDPSKQHYAAWAADGHLVVTDGNVLDYDRVRDDLFEDAERFVFEAVGYDPWGATQLAQELQSGGVPVVEIPQTVPQLSDAMKWTEALVKDGRLHHNGDPVLTFGVSNVVAKEDAKGNVFPRKERPEAKIDPAVALIMLVKLAMAGEQQVRSIFEQFTEEEWTGKPAAPGAGATPTNTTTSTAAAAAPRRRGRSIYEEFTAEEWSR